MDCLSRFFKRLSCALIPVVCPLQPVHDYFCTRLGKYDIIINERTACNSRQISTPVRVCEAYPLEDFTMSQYQLIAFDMDGTLLNSNKQISPETLNAIKRATDAGKTVILCTGRNLAELNAFTEIIPGTALFRLCQRCLCL